METLWENNKENKPSDFWEQVHEIVVDGSWEENPSPEYTAYRQRFEKAQRREYLGEFPISIEIEATYYCNLKCPFCPRVINEGERSIGHMSTQLWHKILNECRENGLEAILMDHEAESMMNPRFFDMVAEAKDAGIIDIWLHTNAMILSPERSARLIDAGLTKINFSIDAHKKETYDVLRVGGNFSRVKKNVKSFLKIKSEKQAHYLRARVSFVEQEENFSEKEDFFKFWEKEKGLNLITFQECIDFRPFEKPDEDTGLTEQQLEEKYASHEPFHCSLPWEMPIIETEGNVIPCGQPVREHTKDFILGNLNEGDSIKSCWNSPKMNDLRELHNKGEWYKNPMCRVCVNTRRNSREEMIALRQKANQNTALPVVDR